MYSNVASITSCLFPEQVAAPSNRSPDFGVLQSCVHLFDIKGSALANVGTVEQRQMS
jgi:hypothetical protein